MLRSFKKTSVLIFTVTALIGCSGCGEKSGTDLKEPPHKPNEGPVKEEGVTRLVTYNIMTFRYDNANFPGGNYVTITDMMKEIEADVVCLNEVDKETSRSNGIYQMERFAQLMGDWDFMYGKAMEYDGGYYGEGLATKARAVKKEEVPLPKGEGVEPRVLVVMEMDDFVVMTTHLDHAVEAAHVGQVNAINEYIATNYGSYKKPIFLGGDLNARPDSGTIALLKEKWDIISVIQNTFPSHMPNRTLDYFLAYKNGAKYEVTATEVRRQFKSGDVTRASDHLPVIVDIKLP